jgi:hypothetical protein
MKHATKHYIVFVRGAGEISEPWLFRWLGHLSKRRIIHLNHCGEQKSRTFSPRRENTNNWNKKRREK